MCATVTLVRMFLIGIVCFLFTILPSVVGQQQCPSGKYGVDCRFDCHCNVMCDRTSGCRGQCASGWDGPTCQRQNVALNMRAQQSSNYSTSSHLAQNAVDGVYGHSFGSTPCTHTAGRQPTAYWSVTLDQVYEIFSFRIYNRDETGCTGSSQCGARLNNFTLSVGNSSTNSYTTCYQDQTSSTAGPGAVITKECQNGVAILGNFVNISLNTGEPLTLCEVEIFACSPGTFGPECNETCGHCADGAFCDTASGHCSSTNPRCESGYIGYQCKTVCDNLHWGPDCEHRCGHCLNNAACNKSSGVCPQSRCAAGYVGDLCITLCDNLHWGPDCENSCGHCLNNATCNKSSGVCPQSRCAAGYVGDLCTTECNGTRWGKDCLQECGHCWNNTACDRVTGVCNVTQGNPRCNPGYLGQRCRQKCGQCWNNTACNTETGVCPDTSPQCNPGYLGDNCTQRNCSEGKYGSDCQYVCHCGPEVTCDPLSGCDVSSCSQGWDGKTCQRQNVALNRPASQSSTLLHNSIRYPAENAVDGKVGGNLFNTPCTHTASSYPSAEWNVTLTEVTSVYRFRIYNRNTSACNGPCGPRLRNFSLSVGNSSSYTTCYQDRTTNTSGPGNVVNKVCDSGPVWGDQVRISLDTGKPLTLCEVQIFVCAPGWYGEMCEMECNTTTRCLRCDLARIQCIRCVQGSWGEDCENTCGNCWDKVCLKTNGTCVQTGDNPRCQAGYNGTDCLTNCRAGWYGPDCVRRCGHCAEGSLVCNITSGDCPHNYNSSTCAPGYGGKQCIHECEDGLWGPDCGQRCGHCWKNTACDKLSGVCPVYSRQYHCSAGYRCPEGTWGGDCAKNCSENCLNSSCSAQSGNCSLGCVKGYEGRMCETVASEKKPPGDPENVDDIVGGVLGALLAVACVVIVVVLFRRRRQQKPSTENNPAEFDGKLQNLQSSKHVREMSNETENVNYEDSNPYENTAEGTKMVPVATFGSYLAEKIATKELITEFKSFKVGLTAKHDAADRPENQGKSRYKSLFAYDHSRVVLKALPEPPSTDYINATYINGYNEPKKYIASQGPTKVMINDFMLMIWEQDVGKVVMVTNLVENTKQKCLQYWPDEGSSQFGVITVTCEHEQMYADFIIRKLELKNSLENGKTKPVTLFHFTSWPDHDAPAHPTGLLDFREKVINYSSPLNGPTVVHCSAGIGRTGTYIALDYLINQAKQTGKVDVPLCVNLLREQRVNMVQTQEQYDFLHNALLEAIQLSHTCVPSVDFSKVYDDLCSKDPRSTETKLKAQFRVLGELTPSPSKSSLATATHPDNQEKNRSPDILAADSSRPFLSSLVPGSNDYINAVFLPSYKMKRAFIITQMPLPNTVVDFWRLVYEQSISTIVMLNTEDNIAKNDGIYWPDKSGEFGPFSVEEVEVNEYDDFSVCEYKLTYKNTKIKVPTKQFRCKFWPSKSCPKSATALLTFIMFIERVEEWRKESGNKSVIVHCRDGVSKSGVYCAASAIMERLVEDKDVNIVQMVKQMRIHRPQIITDLEQFDFLHRMVIEYLNDFQTYSNFM